MLKKHKVTEWDRVVNITHPGDDCLRLAFYREKEKVAIISISWDADHVPTFRSIQTWEASNDDSKEDDSETETER